MADKYTQRTKFDTMRNMSNKYLLIAKGIFFPLSKRRDEVRLYVRLYIFFSLGVKYNNILSNTAWFIHVKMNFFN